MVTAYEGNKLKKSGIRSYTLVPATRERGEEIGGSNDRCCPLFRTGSQKAGLSVMQSAGSPRATTFRSGIA